MNFFKKMFAFSPPEKNIPFNLSKNEISLLYDVRKTLPSTTSDCVFRDIKKNKKYLEKRFDVPHNNDVIVRDILLSWDTKAFIIFYDGMCDGTAINDGIIKALLELPLFNDEDGGYTPDDILKKLLIHNQSRTVKKFDEIVDDINYGACAIFIDGLDTAFAADVKNWPHRSVEKSENEQSIYGPQEAFADMLRGNTAQVRKILKTEKVICEKVTLGKTSKTRGIIMYISDLANESLVNEVRKRLSGISLDYVISVEEVAMMIEDNPLTITGHVLSTERPDRVARALTEGRVALILNGNPHALVFPTNAYELSHTAADAYLRTNFANMSRLIRLFSMFISIFLPGLFIAITLFHEEMLPTYLLYAISASRQNVPFPSLIELLLMEFSFEAIREAGVRMPGPLGSILGIVGGLILGQAAVGAKIVSPIMIIIVAITGIGSFATANYSLGWTFRILKFALIILGASLGFYGIAIGSFVYITLLATSKSFGVPFLSPLPSKSLYKKTIFVSPLWKNEQRPGFLNPKKRKREDKISKKWMVGK